MRLFIIAALFPLSVAADTDSPQTQWRIGDVYEVSRITDTLDQTSDQTSSGSSHDQDAITERVVANRDGGVELEYDLPDASADDRAVNWQFPARVFKPKAGPPQLLSADELKRRLDAWLQRGKIPRTACGQWIFTWNAFRIECDPQSVLQTIATFDLGSGALAEGMLYRSPKAQGAAPLKKTKTGPNGATLTVSLTIDPDVVRKDQAEADLVVAEIMRKPSTLDAALRAHANEIISGTMTITFDTNLIGRVWRRVTITRLTTKQPKGRTTVRTTTETMSRKLIVPEGNRSI